MWNNKTFWDWNFGSWKQSRIIGYWKKAVFCSVLWCLESLKLAGSSALDIAPSLTAAANSAELVPGILLTQRNSSGTQLVPGVLLERAGGATRTPAAGQPCATESFSSAWICQGYGFLDRQVSSNWLLMLLEWSNPPPQCFYSLTFNLQLKTTAKKTPYTKQGDTWSVHWPLLRGTGKCFIPANAVVTPPMSTAHVGTLLSDVDVI